MLPKRTFVFICTLLFSYVSWAQKDIEPLDTEIVRSPIILEAKVVRVIPPIINEKDSGEGEYLQSYILKVLKVFKGDIQVKYIEILVDGEVWFGKYRLLADGPTIPGEGNTALFFLTLPRDTNYIGRFFNSGDTLAHHFIGQWFCDPYSYPYSAIIKKIDSQSVSQSIEEKVYRHIEKLTGIKRKIIDVQ